MPKRSSCRGRQRVVPSFRERHADRPEANPGVEALVEAGPLAHAVHGVDGLAVEQAKVARTLGQDGAGEAVERGIEAARPPAVQQRVGLAINPLGIDDIVAGAPLLHELTEDLRRMLQVAIHQHGGIAAHIAQPGGNGDLLAEIAAEGDGLDALVLRVQRLQRL